MQTSEVGFALWRAFCPMLLLKATDIEMPTGIDNKTIYNYAAAGTIPHVRINPTSDFCENEIRQSLEGQSRRPHWMRRTRMFRQNIKK
jgi:predicted DNA-binding transcriptional regulator AlpA